MCSTNGIARKGKDAGMRGRATAQDALKCGGDGNRTTPTNRRAQRKSGSCELERVGIRSLSCPCSGSLAALHLADNILTRRRPRPVLRPCRSPPRWCQLSRCAGECLAEVALLFERTIPSGWNGDSLRPAHGVRLGWLLCAPVPCKSGDPPWDPSRYLFLKRQLDMAGARQNTSQSEARAALGPLAWAGVVQDRRWRASLTKKAVRTTE